MDPLKANTLDRLRSLEHEIADLKRSLAQLQAEKPNPTNFLQVRPIHASPYTSGGSQTHVNKLVDYDFITPRHRTRTRINYHDRNGRDYTYRSLMVDLGRFDNGGRAISLPPHHDVELFDLSAAIGSSATSGSSRQGYFRRTTAWQTRLGNITDGGIELVATDPGSYLAQVVIFANCERQTASSTEVSAATFRFTPTSANTFIQTAGIGYVEWKRAGYSKPSGLAAPHNDFVSFVCWLHWKPDAGGKLTFTINHANTFFSFSPEALIGQLWLFELGRNRALTGLNYTGTTSFGFTPSNFEFSGTNYVASHTLVESDIGPVSPPPS